jgi:glycosyltransferase involved in cell wall biosynthesis
MRRYGLFTCVRIGILTNFEKGHMDGITRYTVELVRNLLEIDKEDDVVLFHTGEPLHFNDDARVENIQVGKGYGFVLSSIHRNLMIRRLGKDLDILHGPYHGVPFGPFKRVMSVMDVMPLIENWHSREHTFQFKMVMPLMLKTVDKIIAISEKTKSDLVKYYSVEEEKIKVTPLGVLTMDIEPGDQSRILDEMGIEKPYILMVSNLAPIKNVPGLIKAYAKIADSIDHNLILAGKKPDYDEPYELIKKHKLEKRVNFTDRVSDEAVAALYSNADFYVLPSFSEGFGLTIIEAMTYGIPVTCSNAGSLPEVGGDAALFFDPNDIDEMARALKTMATDGGLKRSLKEKGAKRADRYSYKETARLTLDVYREVLEG